VYVIDFALLVMVFAMLTYNDRRETNSMKYQGRKTVFAVFFAMMFGAVMAQETTNVNTTNTSTSTSTVNSTNTNNNTNNNTSTSTVDSTSTNTNNNNNVNTSTSTSTNTNVNTNNNINSGDQTIRNINSGEMTNNNNNVNTSTSTSNNTNVNTNNNSTTSNNTNTNNNVNTSTSNNNNVNKNENSGTMTNINKNDTTVKQISPPPTAVAPAMMSGGNSDLCTTGTSGAVQTQILGVSSGGTVRDMNCERLKNAKVLYDMGMKVAAVATLCQDRRVFDAMWNAGTPCPFEGEIGAKAKVAWEQFPEKIPPHEKEQTDDFYKKTGFGAILGYLLFLAL
jgi:hypothetical protein